MHFRITGSVPLAPTRNGEKLLRSAGLEPIYTPLAVDARVYQPRDRDEAREILGLPQDAFIVGMVAANRRADGADGDRKGFIEAFKAFRLFREHHSDAMFLLHARNLGGHEIPTMAEHFGILDALLLPDDDRTTAGLHGDEEMAMVYAAMNVLLSPSKGEGFGLPLIEAQACGVPVIVTDFGAMPEIGAVGWKVRGERIYCERAKAWQMTPDVEGIVVALETAYKDAGSLCDEARSHALRYDADVVVTEYLIPAFVHAAERASLLTRV
jgi:glycosyltransferase involved in cell wall biosynthesis